MAWWPTRLPPLAPAKPPPPHHPTLHPHSPLSLRARPPRRSWSTARARRSRPSSSRNALESQRYPRHLPQHPPRHKGGLRQYFHAVPAIYSVPRLPKPRRLPRPQRHRRLPCCRSSFSPSWPDEVPMKAWWRALQRRPTQSPASACDRLIACSTPSWLSCATLPWPRRRPCPSASEVSSQAPPSPRRQRQAPALLTGLCHPCRCTSWHALQLCSLPCSLLHRAAHSPTPEEVLSGKGQSRVALRGRPVCLFPPERPWREQASSKTHGGTPMSFRLCSRVTSRRWSLYQQ